METMLALHYFYGGKLMKLAELDLSKLEMRLLLITLETQRDVEENIDKNDRVFGHLYDEIMIKDLNSLIDKFETFYKENY